jgi:hypothetical protein
MGLAVVMTLSRQKRARSNSALNSFVVRSRPPVTVSADFRVQHDHAVVGRLV